ncbi:hypothetical protein [Methylovirgula sp. HY1]|uniref:hypothetical protein n=1 Tax=Methylovirgula sp. HY1 TaxID=2822761 RepID=UPI001C5AE685|nr:hypothetical protein [Methylovirgula sp. HY1]QXX76682.1 hypothetical protein MHY1_p00204 [Methylovirgula sp. HY1]
MTIRIATLFVRHGAEKYPTALDELEGFFARRLPNVERELIVIDNALPATHCSQIENGILVGGSNKAWEFSAWDSGVAFLGAKIFKFDFVHLVTSAFGEHYVRYIERFDEHMLERLRGRAVAIGHVDCYNSPVVFFGRMSQSWIRSSFVFIPPTEIRLLGSLVSIEDGCALFSGDPKYPFRSDAPLSASYQANIIGWLTGAGTGQGTVWHSRFDLSVESLVRFEAKTLAILNEHALAIRLRAQGCAVIDATWLATHAKQAQRQHISPGTFPHWRDQLALRDEAAQRVR